MKKVFAVIRREMVERIRTKAFLISTFLLPILMVVMMVLPALMMGGGERTQRVAIVDGTPDGQLGAAVQTGLATATFTKDGESRPLYDVALIAAPNGVQLAEDSLVALTGFSREKMPTTLDGVLVLTSKTLESGEATYLGANAGSLQGVGALQATLSQALMRSRLRESGVDEALVMRAMMRADITSQKVADGKLTGESGEASFVLAYGMGFLLYFVILIYGAQTATSVIEEKTSRIMEVLASSLTPFQMLLGKIVGVGLTGLLQVGIWGGVVFVLSSQRAAIAGLVGLDASAMAAMPIPSMPLDLLVVFLLYFALGFVLYGALYAAIGSMVNSMQEMQQFMMPVTMLIVFGFFGVFAVMKDPTAGIGLIFSYIPFFAPFVMPVRWSMASVPVTQLILSLASMVAGILAVAWLAARIYRVGILMYGKKPTIREVFRWVRQG